MNPRKPNVYYLSGGGQLDLSRVIFISQPIWRSAGDYFCELHVIASDEPYMHVLGEVARPSRVPPDHVQKAYARLCQQWQTGEWVAP